MSSTRQPSSVELILPQPKNVFALAAWPVSGVAIAVNIGLPGIDLTGRLYMQYFLSVVCNKCYMWGGGKCMYYNAIQTVKNINLPCVGLFSLLDQQLRERRHCIVC